MKVREINRMRTNREKKLWLQEQSFLKSILVARAARSHAWHEARKYKATHVGLMKRSNQMKLEEKQADRLKQIRENPTIYLNRRINYLRMKRSDVPEHLRDRRYFKWQEIKPYMPILFPEWMPKKEEVLRQMGYETDMIDLIMNSDEKMFDIYQEIREEYGIDKPRDQSGRSGKVSSETEEG